MVEQAKERTARNPYAPPEAMVADVAAVETRAPRPVQVSWAVRLFWLDVALSIVQSVVALYLLFVSPGRKWFRPSPAA